ncbi:MAG: ribosome biogenesis GTP-binding protein YihA/YsxC [candidate division NC10 bacterium]|nr:ribosome biogenesis GTP-binding protein YihA/YsxC [candidate division NC10 bacterium]
MRVTSVTFAGSATSPAQYPKRALPEVAFAGRSNVGKSSLINRLLGRRKLARVSRTPGRTRVLNFFLVNDWFYFVDLPGYGYAAVPGRVRETWGPMIEEYLTTRPTLRGVVLLLDARHPPQAHDVATRAWLAEERIAHLLVLTKIDKVPRGQRGAHLGEAAARLGLQDPGLLLPFSALTGEGEAALWKALDAALAAAPEGR